MLTLIFGVRPTPVLPPWHVKDPSHSAKSAGGRLHLNTHIPLTQRSRSGLTMLLSRQSVGIHHETSSHAAHRGTLAWSQSSQLAELLRTDPGLNSGISLCELISTLQKKKKKKSTNYKSPHHKIFYVQIVMSGYLLSAPTAVLFVCLGIEVYFELCSPDDNHLWPQESDCFSFT